MDNAIVRAFLWRDIIRLGFSPAGDKDKSSWLHQYGISLKYFCETENFPSSTPNKIDGKLKCNIDCFSALDISFEYEIEASNKFTVRIMNPLNNLLFVHDYDYTHYCFPQDERVLNGYRRAEAIRLFERTDLEAVIKSLMTHPTPHQHIESPINEHVIRIGGGIINPFQYLFHLRFQFCFFERRREEELNRLVDLFESAIREDKPVSINNLMRVP